MGKFEYFGAVFEIELETWGFGDIFFNLFSDDRLDYRLEIKFGYQENKYQD